MNLTQKIILSVAKEKKTYKAEDVLRLKKEKNVCWLFFHIGENAAGNER